MKDILAILHSKNYVIIKEEDPVRLKKAVRDILVKDQNCFSNFWKPGYAMIAVPKNG